MILQMLMSAQRYLMTVTPMLLVLILTALISVTVYLVTEVQVYSVKVN